MLQPHGQDTSFESAYTDCSEAVDSGEPNHFMVRRNLVHSMLDVALLLANVSQLRTVLHSDTTSNYYIMTLTLISGSIVLQIIIALLMIAMWSLGRQTDEQPCNKCAIARSDSRISQVTKDSVLVNLVHNQKLKKPKRTKEQKSAAIDKVVLVLITFVIIANVFITGIGLYEVEKKC